MLDAAETSAYEHQRRSHYSYTSPVYAPGTEYVVCQAQAQLMAAIVCVLNESVTESIKGFYKLRKAYLALDGVMEAEARVQREQAADEHPPSTSKLSLSRDDAKPASSRAITSNEDGEADAFSDAQASLPQAELPVLPSTQIGGDKKASGPAPDHATPAGPEPADSAPGQKQASKHKLASVLGNHPVDEFITSGSNFSFGVLLLMISLVPPTFATVLKIVGFRGDKERGVQMLWRATEFHNMYGAMASLFIFMFYDGMSTFCDIIVRDEKVLPKARCRALLDDMRQRYPKSFFWLIEEARLMASDKKLEEAIDFLRECPESALQQLEGLRWFELSMNNMFKHDYQSTSDAFQKCMTLNTWSHGLYHYICGCAHLELYRVHKAGDAAEAAKQRDLAKKSFAQVPLHAGRKRFMARQLPFDMFANRKIRVWESRAAAWQCDLVDAVGVSPLEEMIYFWNGYKRMEDGHLATSLERLEWSASGDNPHWDKVDVSEKGCQVLLRAAVLRCLGKTAEAQQMLETEIVTTDKALYRGGLKEGWVAPCARYEMAACLWSEANALGKPDEHLDQLRECGRRLDDVSKWESFDMEARYVRARVASGGDRADAGWHRIGIKVTTGKSTLRRFGVDV